MSPAADDAEQSSGSYLSQFPPLPQNRVSDEYLGIMQRMGATPTFLRAAKAVSDRQRTAQPVSNRPPQAAKTLSQGRIDWWPTARDVRHKSEYTALLTASMLSWLGGYATRIAVTALVYARTQSVLLSAAAFAVSYLPWLGVGQALMRFTDRYASRTIMICSDLTRFVIIAFLATTEFLPVPAVITLMFCIALLGVSGDSARSDLLPEILDDQTLANGLSLQQAGRQTAILVGYGAGATLYAVDARLALLLGAATVGISALLVGLRIRGRQRRPRAIEWRGGILRQVADGYAVVANAPVPRAIALVVFAGVACSIVPEGLAAAWSGEFANGRLHAPYMSAILIAATMGLVAGAALVNWLVRPTHRERLIRPLALVAPSALIPAFFGLGIVGIVGITLLSSAALGAMLPAANSLFVQVLPQRHRTTAFVVMQSGLQLAQGGAVLLTGWLAESSAVSNVVGWYGIGGLVVMAVVVASWPSTATVAHAVAAGRLQGDAAMATTHDNERDRRDAGAGPAIAGPVDRRSGVFDLVPR